MGEVVSYTCRSCGKKGQVTLGTEIRFQERYDEMMYEAKNYGFGRKLKILLDQYPEAGVDFRPCLYACRCGWWEPMDHMLDVYVPLPEEKRKPDGPKYRRIPRTWACPRCHGPMHKIADSELKEQRCLYCGGELEFHAYVQFD